MKRIAIIGNAGGGKSTLAQALSENLKIQLFEVDPVQWQPGWTPTPEAEAQSTHEGWLKSSKWIIDGWGGFENMEERFSHANTIIFIDFPIWLHYWWATKRHVQAILGVSKHWPPPGCKPFPVTTRLFKMMWTIHRHLHRDLEAMIYRHEGNSTIIHIRTKKAFERLLHFNQHETYEIGKSMR